MIPVPVGRARSIRSATGGGSGLWAGGSGSFFLADGERGRGFACGQRFALRPQTALRRTRDPSPSSGCFGAEHGPPGRWGAASGR